MAKPTATAGGIVEIAPPPITRPREGSVKPEDAAKIAELVKAGKWGSDGKGYRTKKEAQNMASRHKRSVAVAGNLPEKRVASRVWEDAERPEGQRFVFGIGPRNTASATTDAG